ncbi:GH24 family phage-related lysozyme (muramidase) [Sphaerotilus sulfidivorans]|uniref:Lysozyme n=1 Tax=Sphaerotilus sulfidivorans TaxID=639200 RepID=A0ABV2IT56_9BURK|nr:lysozyme [Sphaerotilus sulfidivorans]NZD48091.1 lysozyme [Sphaerotilus sulfidivorans]
MEKAAKSGDIHKIDLSKFEGLKKPGSRLNLTVQEGPAGKVTTVEYHDASNGKSMVVIRGERPDGTAFVKSFDERGVGEAHFEDKSGRVTDSRSFNLNVQSDLVINVEHKSAQPIRRRAEKAPSTNPQPPAPEPARPQSSRPERSERPVIDKESIEMIKRHEGNGVKGKPFERYVDIAGVQTIGYGTTRPGQKLPAKITPAQAEAYLLEDIERADQSIQKLVKVPLSTGQRRALRSFVYNLGARRLSKSTLLKELNKGNYSGAAAQFEKWDKARDPKTGSLVRVQGLSSRRTDERRHFEQLDSNLP